MPISLLPPIATDLGEAYVAVRKAAEELAQTAADHLYPPDLTALVIAQLKATETLLRTTTATIWLEQPRLPDRL